MALEEFTGYFNNKPVEFPCHVQRPAKLFFSHKIHDRAGLVRRVVFLLNLFAPRPYP